MEPPLGVLLNCDRLQQTQEGSHTDAESLGYKIPFSQDSKPNKGICARRGLESGHLGWGSMLEVGAVGTSGLLAWNYAD